MDKYQVVSSKDHKNVKFEGTVEDIWNWVIMNPFEREESSIRVGYGDYQTLERFLNGPNKSFNDNHRSIKTGPYYEVWRDHGDGVNTRVFTGTPDKIVRWAIGDDPVVDPSNCRVYTNHGTYVSLTDFLYDEKVGVMTKTNGDNVNHPSHYTAYEGLEIIDLTEQMNFCRGNAVKYITRAGLKDKSREAEDLRKAVWYLEREITRIEKKGEK